MLTADSKKKMTKEEIWEVVRLHKLCLLGERSGQRANLEGADLRSANLRGANLRRADLGGADLVGAIFHNGWRVVKEEVWKDVNSGKD